MYLFNKPVKIKREIVCFEYKQEVLKMLEFDKYFEG